MKKLCIILTALCLMLVTVSFACAASLPSVSFAQKSGSINGGMPYTLTVSIKKALPEDLSVEILNNATDEVLTILIPAGEKTASAEIATGVVDQQEKVVYSFAESDAYKGGSSHTLTIAKLPQVKFYLDVYMGKVGKDLTVRVHADTPSRVVKGSVYQLRDKDGAVLAEKEWKNGKNDLYFKFRVTEEMIGRHDLSVDFRDDLPVRKHPEVVAELGAIPDDALLLRAREAAFVQLDQSVDVRQRGEAQRGLAAARRKPLQIHSP